MGIFNIDVLSVGFLSVDFLIFNIFSTVDNFSDDKFAVAIFKAINIFKVDIFGVGFLSVDLFRVDIFYFDIHGLPQKCPFSVPEITINSDSSKVHCNLRSEQY